MRFGRVFRCLADLTLRLLPFVAGPPRPPLRRLAQLRLRTSVEEHPLVSQRLLRALPLHNRRAIEKPSLSDRHATIQPNNLPVQSGGPFAEEPLHARPRIGDHPVQQKVTHRCRRQARGLASSTSAARNASSVEFCISCSKLISRESAVLSFPRPDSSKPSSGC